MVWKKRVLLIVLLLVLPLALSYTNLNDFEDIPLSSLRLMKDPNAPITDFTLALGVVWEDECSIF